MAIKISTRIQVLLQPENLNPRIITDLNLDPVMDLAPVRVTTEPHDLINDIL